MTGTPDLEKPLRYLKGVGEKLSLLFAKKDILKVRDLLYYFPRTYEDRRKISTLDELQAGMTTSVVGRIRRSHPVFFSKSKRRAFEVVLEAPDSSNFLSAQTLSLTWFHSPYLKNKLEVGTLVMAMGEVQNFRGKFQMVHPDVELIGKTLTDEFKTPGILPVYSETEGLFQKTIRKIVTGAVKTFAAQVQETLPDPILEKYKWPKIGPALYSIHSPKPDSDFEALVENKTPAHQRLIFEEFFKLSVALAARRDQTIQKKGIEFKKPEHSWEQLKKNLPFKFTNAQKKVLHEILDDMTSSKPMQRLVQGDVGCGKTVVAAAAALIAMDSGYQVAMMAPTELLIDQHFKNFEKWFAGMSIRCVKLTGSLPAAEKKKILKEMASESPLMVFGTHALFEKDVEFQKLGLVIIDEQHRFGVRQRADLVEKGSKISPPDLLVMTATPIPRTLALTVYGDLDISVIDELPPGRKPIVTKVFIDKQRTTLEKSILEQLKLDRQAYIVFPLIEESEKLPLKSIEVMMPQIEKAYSEFKVALLHGKMKYEDRQKILDDFKANKIQVLVSTTVVEVGVDIPNATVMVIENAERFGLSQLHQLRGRVGRGAEQSFCFLMASHMGTPEIVQRLRTMEKTQDGFKLAEVDLEMRGPGEFLGTRQSGMPAFELARLPRDLHLLQLAREEAANWGRQLKTSSSPGVSVTAHEIAP
ncbi:MAG: ATP-dependent DNA helicase RecG [Deltaproteobacteria bacterium]|nr:ATP-dependent DNA helicase RecG [Deltaproteobacteria bacterium]